MIVTEDNYAIFILQKEMEKIKKRLDGDVIVDLRFRDEIEEDKRKMKQLKRSIEVLHQPTVIKNEVAVCENECGGVAKYCEKCYEIESQFRQCY